MLKFHEHTLYQSYIHVFYFRHNVCIKFFKLASNIMIKITFQEFLIASLDNIFTNLSLNLCYQTTIKTPN